MFKWIFLKESCVCFIYKSDFLGMINPQKINMSLEKDHFKRTFHLPTINFHGVMAFNGIHRHRTHIWCIYLHVNKNNQMHRYLTSWYGYTSQLVCRISEPSTIGIGTYSIHSSPTFDPQDRNAAQVLSDWPNPIEANVVWRHSLSVWTVAGGMGWAYTYKHSMKGNSYTPSRELTHPIKNHVWRWFSFSQGGIC